MSSLKMNIIKKVNSCKTEEKKKYKQNTNKERQIKEEIKKCDKKKQQIKMQFNKIIKKSQKYRINKK